MEVAVQAFDVEHDVVVYLSRRIEVDVGGVSYCETEVGNASGHVDAHVRRGFDSFALVDDVIGA